MSKYLHKQRTAPKSRQCFFLITCCVSSASCFFFFLCFCFALCVFFVHVFVGAGMLSTLKTKLFGMQNAACKGGGDRAGGARQKGELSSTTSFFIICKLLRCRCALLCMCVCVCVVLIALHFQFKLWQVFAETPKQRALLC